MSRRKYEGQVGIRFKGTIVIGFHEIRALNQSIPGFADALEANERFYRKSSEYVRDYIKRKKTGH